MKTNFRITGKAIRDYAVKAWTSVASWLKVLPDVAMRSRSLVIAFNIIVVIIVIASAFFFITNGVPAIRECLVPRANAPVSDSSLTTDPLYRKIVSAVQRDLQTAERRYDALTPGQSFLVINTTDNRFYLYRYRKLVREGFCSSGSYVQLLSHDSREWIFRTPKGVFRIQGKTTYPVWKKPDWAFIEEGLPVPPPGHHSRFESGVLGDYALSLGDGYLIHGTLYKRFLGMPVTHGCVRLNDDDLEYVFNSLNVGSKVFIY